MYFTGTAKRVMFEIYRDSTGSGEYRAVYFTELDDHNREGEISRALSGEHIFDGFLRVQDGYEGKALIDCLLARLNQGEKLATDEIRQALESRLE